jgi:hypothetical protein
MWHIYHCQTIRLGFSFDVVSDFIRFDFYRIPALFRGRYPGDEIFYSYVNGAFVTVRTHGLLILLYCIIGYAPNNDFFATTLKLFFSSS